MINRHNAFTLVELLIVVAIISILTAIAVPNFLSAQVRAKVVKAKSDIRVISLALESYYVDENRYPQAVLVPPDWRLIPLTTPVDYISSLPHDAFFSKMYLSIYRYGAMDIEAASRWILAGVGPDRTPSIDPIEFYPGYQPGLFMGQVSGFDYMIYDPTNGTISWGDVVRASDFIAD